MGLRYHEQIFGKCFFITTTFIDWQEFGKIEGVYECLADSLKYYLKKYKALLPAYVLMPSHLHLLIVIEGKKLAAFIRDFKKYLAQEALKKFGIDDSQVWMRGYDRQVIYSERAFRIKLEYIHNNPVRSGLVSDPDKWQWSSARCYYADDAGAVPVWKDWSF